MMDRKLGILLPLTSPEEAAARTFSSVEMAIAEKLHRKAIVGSAEQVAARLKELAKSLELDELVVVTWTYDPAPRHRSYELLAQAFESKQRDFHSA
jgi:alkanesulfonate monooxygenase SsuD/methylene tetrahydromethanopterin reductase-like flavin-dependent oxidoreductase (luciferase family)